MSVVIGFSHHNVLRVHLCCSNVTISHSFSWLNNIPDMDISYLFNHSSVDEYLGCFYFLPIINNAAINNSCTEFCVDMCTTLRNKKKFLLAIYLGVGLLDQIIIQWLTSGGKCQTVFQSNCHFTFLLVVYECSDFSASLLTLTIWIFDSSHHRRCEVVSYCVVVLFACFGLVYIYIFCLLLYMFSCLYIWIYFL